MRRKNIRLSSWDYATNCCYHVTICTHDRQPLFGKVIASDGLTPAHVEFSPAGVCCDSELRRVACDESRMRLIAFKVMPNHVHLLLWIRNDVEKPTALLDAVRYLKSTVTRELRQIGYHKPVWQKSFYETAIRNDEQLATTLEYIENNPAKWAEDKYYDG